MRFPRQRTWLLLLSIAVASKAALATTCSAPPWQGLAGVPPLTDYPPGYLYLGKYPGFLYDNSNQDPADHDADGRALAGAIVPRDIDGAPCTGTGCRIVLLAIGASNTTIEFCGGLGINGDPEDPESTTCPLASDPQPYNQSESFIAKALADPRVDHQFVVPVDGAKGNEPLSAWDPNVSGMTEYERVRAEVLAPANLSRFQVQAVWIDDANEYPQNPLGAPTTGTPDTIVAERHLGAILRTIRREYPNLQQVFLSSRAYAGYGTAANPPNPLIPEPYAYEGGFTTKWLIAAQIAQERGAGADPDAGNLDYKRFAAPWTAWGPYLWANGPTPRSDGLAWLSSDFRWPYPTGDKTNECEHISTYGEQKASTLLLNFLLAAPHTRWFLAGRPGCAIVPDSLRVAADRRTITWTRNGAGGTFDVVHGDVASLVASSGSFKGASCIASGLANTGTNDPSQPGARSALYELARCHGDTWNDGTQLGNRDSSLTVCP